MRSRPGVVAEVLCLPCPCGLAFQMNLTAGQSSQPQTMPSETMNTSFETVSSQRKLMFSSYSRLRCKMEIETMDANIATGSKHQLCLLTAPGVYVPCSYTQISLHKEENRLNDIFDIATAQQWNLYHLQQHHLRHTRRPRHTHSTAHLELDDQSLGCKS
jgi:hypothetical protein